MFFLHPRLSVFFAIFSFGNVAYGEKLTIAAASSLKFALDKVVESFNREHSPNSISVVYGSSGKLFAQIRESAPFDAFLSADMTYLSELESKGMAASHAKVFALGRLALWSAARDASQMTLASLTSSNIARIAVANPKLAPYGARAEEALRAANVFDAVQRKLVYGLDVAQAVQYVQAGNADVGIVAHSLLKSPELRLKQNHFLIPQELHRPLEMGILITKRASASNLAGSFVEYMLSKNVQETLKEFGFSSPKSETLQTGVKLK